VQVRLGLSSIHGIGVFAIEAIAEGAHLFESDRSGLVWIDKAALEEAGLSDEARRLYHDFGISRGDKIGCPRDFNNLTPGWYLNEPAAGDEPNVRIDPELNFFAARDIAKGEELTVRYTDFSEAP
jgi:hypothetical protein